METSQIDPAFRLFTCVSIAAIAGPTVAFVFAVELLERFFSTEHIGRMEREQAVLPVEFAGYQWSVLSPVTWGIPFLLGAVSILLFRRGFRRSKFSWSKVT